MNTMAWFQKNVSGFGQLASEDISAVAEFSLTWSLFEADLLNRNASETKLNSIALSRISQTAIDRNELEPHFCYYQNRYVMNGATNSLYDELYLSRGRFEPFVRGVLCAQSAVHREKVKALLLIIYRLRNNLLHGEKWRYGLKGQLGNFNHATSTILTIMDYHRGGELSG